jgi:superfamily II DNA/RNA helicase
MVRRTRSEIQRWFGKDLEAQKLKFPDVADPEPFFYELNSDEDDIFVKTIELFAQKFKYSRYTPLLPKYFKGEVDQPTRLAQENMGKFMKILMIKRLESSFFAFENTLGRFINSYQFFLKEFERGNVYVSKKYINKVFEYGENDDEEAIQRLIDEDKAQRYDSINFKPEFKEDLETDLETLLSIEVLWKTIKRDPKFLTFKDKLNSIEILKKQKLIIFTESKETATYLGKQLDAIYPGKVLVFTGGSSSATREKVIENFDAKSHFPKDDYRILVSTEVLSEGVNLHRSNVVINYDIPWNPTRLMQRVGRINRVDTKFDKIYSYNFFPTKQSNDQIKLKEAAETKIHAFISMLGSDARLLTEGEPIESHELFNRLMSKKTITGEDESEESELKYLHLIKTIRDENLDLFEKIKRLPKKARTARSFSVNEDCLLTYFRKGKLQKFYKTNNSLDPEELDFMTAAKMLEVKEDEKKENIKEDLYKLLDKNKKAFEFSTIEDLPEAKGRGGRDSATQVLRILKSTNIKSYKGYTDEDEIYLKKVIQEIEEGGLPKQTTKTLVKLLSEELKNTINPLRILALLKMNIADEFFIENQVQNTAKTSGPREVILSEYLIANNK